MWDFTVKGNDEDIKYNTKLVTDWSRLKFRINYRESYNPVMKAESFGTVLAVAANKDYTILFFDVETAYMKEELDTAVKNPHDGLKIEGGKYYWRHEIYTDCQKQKDSGSKKSKYIS